MQQWSRALILLLGLSLSACGGSGSSKPESEPEGQQLSIQDRQSADLNLVTAESVSHFIWGGSASPSEVYYPQPFSIFFLSNAQETFLDLLAYHVGVGEGLTSDYSNEFNTGVESSLNKVNGSNEITLDISGFKQKSYPYYALSGKMTMRYDLSETESSSVVYPDSISFENLLVVSHRENYTLASGSLNYDVLGLRGNLDIEDHYADKLIVLDQLRLKALYGNPVFEWGVEGNIYIQGVGKMSVSSIDERRCEKCSPYQKNNFSGIRIMSESSGLIDLYQTIDGNLLVESEQDGLLGEEKSYLYEWSTEGLTKSENNKPVIQKAVLEQEVFSNTDIAVKELEIYDSNLDALQVEFEWLVNNVKVDTAATETLSHQFFTRGDEIRVTVIASDGDLEASWSDTVVVSNTDPIVTVTASRVNALAGEKILFSSEVVDPDNEQYAYSWEVSHFDSYASGDAEIVDYKQASTEIRFVKSGEYRVSLRMNDGEGWAYDDIHVNVSYEDLFQEAEVISLESANGKAAVIADLNSDGRNDLAISITRGQSKYEYSGILLFLQNDQGKLNSPIYYSANFHNHSYNMTQLKTADFNNDGKLDLVSTHRDGPMIWYQNELGELSDGVLYRASTYGLAGHKVLPGDFDGDGKNDLLFYGGTDSPDLYRQYEEGGLGDAIPVNGEALTALYSQEVIDVGDDGVDEVVGYSSNYLESKVIAHSFNETSGVTENELFDPGESIEVDNMVAVDMNTDGLTDILMQGDCPNLWNCMVLLSQDELGEFHLGNPFKFYRNPDQLVTGDVDGDGLIDIIVGNGGSRSVGVYLQKKVGVFIGEHKYAIEYCNPEIEGLKVGDLNNDNKLDIVQVCDGETNILYAK